MKLKNATPITLNEYYGTLAYYNHLHTISYKIGIINNAMYFIEY